MTVFLFGGTKGGIGKSTMACNAAAWLAEDAWERHKKRITYVGLLDTDVQKHASSWATLRAERYPQGAYVASSPVLAAGYENAVGAARDMKRRFEHVVIDAGGRDSVELRAALTIADVLVMPFQPSQFDLYSLGDMAKLTFEAHKHNPGLRTIAFVNRASTNWSSREGEEARAAIAEVFSQVASTIVHERKAFKTSVEAGRAVFEIGRRGEPSASEFTSLWLEIEEVAP